MSRGCLSSRKLQRYYFFGYAILGLLVVWLPACAETFEVNAPYEDIYVVYAVLDPLVDTQYVRVSLAFQVEEDAVAFAEDHDPSVSDVEVAIVGAGKRYEGEFVEGIVKEGHGDFAGKTSAYRFVTEQEDRLLSGEVYSIEIRKSDQPDFWLSGSTRIPNQPRIISPLRYVFQGNYCLPEIAVEDSVSVLFRRNDRVGNVASHFEIKWILRYAEGGAVKEVSTRPSRIFDRNVRCGQAGTGNLCYSTGFGSVLDEWRREIPSSAEPLPMEASCSRVPILLTRNAELQVTALDSVLARYILSNDPRYLNMNTIRREVSNLTGSVKAVGIVGSISYDNQPFLLSDCAESILGWNGIPISLACY